MIYKIGQKKGRKRVLIMINSARLNGVVFVVTEGAKTDKRVQFITERK